MNIKDASADSGLSVDTIRYYEKAGMMPRLRRDGRGWRVFDGAAVEWLRNLERLRATGMPMADMKRFASLVHAREVTPDVMAARLQILHSHALRLAERQAAIAACQAYLDHKISVYTQTDGGKS